MSVIASLPWNLVKTIKWDIPSEVLTTPAATERLDERVRYDLKQARSCVKKLLASIAEEDKHNQLHIYQLAKGVCQGTRVNVTIKLCGRLAILHAEIALKDLKRVDLA